MKSFQLLIVDDDSEIRNLLASYLTREGYTCQVVGSAAEARQQLVRQSFDLVLLDIMMPGEDGVSLCHYLSLNHPEVAVILVSARTDSPDRVLGLESGADDYIGKPFEPRELLARVRAVLRRSPSATGRRVVEPAPSQTFEFADWCLEVATQTLTDPDGVEVALSSSEFKLLEVFLRHPRHVLSRDQLLDLTRGCNNTDHLDRAIDNQVSRLRRKIESDSRQPQLIKTVRGGGYQLNCKVLVTG